MDSSSSSNSFSVGSASPGAVVLLYSVGAQGNEARGGAAREDPTRSVPASHRPRPLAQKSGSRGRRGGGRWLTWFPRQRCIAACVNVCMLLEVSMGDGSSGSFPLVPSRSLHQARGLQKAPDTGMRRENWISVSSQGYLRFSLNRRNLRV